MEIRYEVAFKQLITFLEKIEKRYDIKYYLVGGILTSLYSELRTTLDIDFVVDIFFVNYNIESYILLLKQNEFYPFQDWETTANLARETKLIQYLDRQESIKLDNYIIDRQTKNKYKRIGIIALERRIRVSFLEIECWATSKEDFILSKLIYGGWQDFADALGCWMRFNDTLNLSYMNKTSIELGVQKELELLKSGIDDPDDYFKQINEY